MRFFILLGLTAVALGHHQTIVQAGQGGQGGQGGYPGELGQDYLQQQYVVPGQQPFVIPGGQYPIYPYVPQQGIPAPYGQYQYQYQLPYSYQQLGYSPITGYPQTQYPQQLQFQYPFQVGVGPTIVKEAGVQVPVPIAVEYPVIKEIDVIQPGISGAVPLTTMDAALLELEDKDYGHYEKYYYGRSGIPRTFIRPVRQPLDGNRLRSAAPGGGGNGGIPINRYIRPGVNSREKPFSVNKREHYEIYKYH